MNEFLKKLKTKGSLPYILLALAAGVILMILPNGDTQTAETGKTATEEYRALLENELSELICGMEGVDDCSVVVTLSYGYEYLYATDQHVNETANGKETEKTVVLATESGGESPILLREKQPIVNGVAVVCPGADYTTCTRIAELLTALFGIESTQISIQT